MKTIVRKIVHLHIAALCLASLASALAGPGKADQAVPFHGVIESLEIATIQFPVILVDATGSGTGTRLGRFSLTYELEVDLLTTPFETSGTAVFTAANGDRLFTDIAGLGTEDAAAYTVSVVEVHTVTGGTGRFEDATGTFIRTYLLDRASGATSGSFHGTLSIDYAAHPVQ